ncbi:MAG TPA: methyl-accepting chemotaxis protein [Burkholderiales bacterium]|nr:methyl-accepting chemotaxis protein [Burkholderiales bacterium]
MDLKLPEGLEAAVQQPKPKKQAKAAVKEMLGFTAAQQFQVLSGLLVLFLLLAVVMTYFAAREGTRERERIATSTEMEMLSQRMAKGSELAVTGNPAGFEQLKESRDEFAANLDLLSNGGARGEIQIPAAQDDEVVALLSGVKARWEDVEKSATTLLNEQKALTDFGKSVAGINNTDATLLETTEAIVLMMVQAGASNRELLVANQQVMLTQRMAKNANALLSGEVVDPELMFLLSKDTNSFRENLGGLATGSDALRISAVRDGDARKRLEELQVAFKGYEGNAKIILGNAQKLIASKEANRNIVSQSENLLQDSGKLSDAFHGGIESSRLSYVIAAVISAVLALVCAGYLGLSSLNESRRQAREAEERKNMAESESRKNQDAILRLLDEMGSLADGDLTVQVKVTEDITGAIADSVNYTVEELRGVVTGINKASAQLSQGTEVAQSVSTRLLQAAQVQSQQIQDTSASVQEMVQSIEEVSLSAQECARVAEQSIAAAETGAGVVQDSVTGMNSIREQIQDTSKRIKRLGESSQEIGEIVELIADITEQTNVLALNAAIQAASAGEAGRGFTVVAEEVQRLAERSAEATRQITTLVKTIQTDTQDAVAAMEKSTQEVVQETKMSDATSAALNEIGRVSWILAELIEGITFAMRSQAESAIKVAENMEGILEITGQTTQGTQQTAQSMRQIAKLAGELKSSVAGFKL